VSVPYNSYNHISTVQGLLCRISYLKTADNNINYNLNSTYLLNMFDDRLSQTYFNVL